MLKINIKKLLLSIVDWSLLAVIALVPIYFAFFQENYTVFDLNKSVLLRLCLLVILSACLVLFALSAKVPRFTSKSIFLLGGLFLLAVIISTIFSLHPMISLFGSYERQQGLYNIVAYLLVFFLLIIFLHSQEKLKKALIVLNISAAVICLYGLVQALGLDFLYWSETSFSRIFSTFGQPNFFGHYLVVMVPLTIYSYFFIAQRFLYKSLLVVLLVSELVCLLFTYSRGAWVALAAAFFVALVFSLWHFKKQFIALSLTTLAILTIVVLLLPNVRSKIVSHIIYDSSLSTRILSIVDFSTASSNNIRLKYWQASWLAFKEASLNRKLFGFGPDVLTSVFVRQYQPDWAYSERINAFPDRAHNNFFDITLQFGLLGLVALLSLVFYCVKKLYAVMSNFSDYRYWLALAISSSLVAYLVNNLFSFSLTAMSLLFFVLLALAWRINDTTDKISYQTISFFQPLSRWLIAVLSIVLLVVFFYVHDIRPLVADYYYMEVKKAEARQDCWYVINNMENVMEWYPTSHYYARAYLSHNINCFSTLSSEESKRKIITNITDQSKNLTDKEMDFYSLIDLSHAYSILGYYSDSKYYALAEVYYKNMLAINPRITTTYQDYGRMKLWQAKYQEARKLFLDGLAVTPALENTPPNSNIGFIGSIAKQLAYFHYLIALTYNNENNTDQAILSYNEALKIDPSLVLAYKDLGDIAYRKKNIIETIAYNKKAFSFDPNNSLWPLSLAKLYFEIGDKKTALRYAEQTLKIDPSNDKIKEILEKLK